MTTTAIQRGSLADCINAEHDACLAAANDALEHAMRCGDLLIRAKAGIQHGQWQDWLADNFAGSVRSAQVYMRLADNRNRLGKAQASALLSIEDALQLISPPTARLWPEFDLSKHPEDMEREIAACAAATKRWARRGNRRLAIAELPLTKCLAIRDEASQIANGWAEFNIRCQRAAGSLIGQGQLQRTQAVEEAERDTLATIIRGMEGGADE